MPLVGATQDGDGGRRTGIQLPCATKGGLRLRQVILRHLQKRQILHGPDIAGIGCQCLIHQGLTAFVILQTYLAFREQQGSGLVVGPAAENEFSLAS